MRRNPNSTATHSWINRVMLALCATVLVASSAMAQTQIFSLSGNNCQRPSAYQTFAQAAGGTLTVAATLPANLSSYDGVILNSCFVGFSATDVSNLSAWVNAGGVLFAIADGFAGWSPSWPVMNQLMSALGVGMELTGGLANNLCITDQIDPDPLTAGVSSIENWLPGSIQISGGAFSLIRTSATCPGGSAPAGTTWLGGQTVGNGLVIYSGDTNAFEDFSNLMLFPRTADNSDTTCFIGNLFGNAVEGCEGAAPDIDINIKPGSDPNSINLCSGGTTPVTIWGSDTLDVNTIDPSQLILASATVKTVGKTQKLLCSIEDAGSLDENAFDSLGAPDGFPDLKCHFETVELTELDDTSQTAELSITGCDSVTPFPSCAPGDPGFFETTAVDSVNIVKSCN